MPDISPRNLPFYRCFQYLEIFYEAGVRHIVLSPGSRSTPLTMAAAAHDGFEKHVILDERSAAFYALGIGKSTAVPALLICTSGTAVANYYPAVIEARKSAVPLLALTADRPPRLQGTGANQTIDQQHIFGDYPLFFNDMGLPESNADLTAMQSLIKDCMKIVLSTKGPGHLNFPFDKPLEPDPEFVAEVNAQCPGPGQPLPIPEAPSKASAKLDASVIKKINKAQGPLMVIGQLPAGIDTEHCLALAQKLKAPVLSEAGFYASDLCLQQFDGMLRNTELLDALKPDLILRFGLQPASKGLLQALKYWKPAPHVYFKVSGLWSDVAASVTSQCRWNGNRFELNEVRAKGEQWLMKWKQKCSAYRKQADTLINETASLTDGHVYHLLSRQLPEYCTVFFSNSFSARDRSLFGQWSTKRVFTNRGASGIDGINSTAMGTLSGSKMPGLLFTGDLAFLHDTNALLNHHTLSQALIIVVINNSGGSIFRMLPIAEHREYFNTYFETPQQADIAKLADSYGIEHTRITTIGELRAFDIKNELIRTKPGVHIVECVTDPGQSMELRQKLWAIT